MSHSTDGTYLEERAEALQRLRNARRRNRIAKVDYFDAFYKAYVGAFCGGLGLYLAAGWLGDAPIRGEGLETVQDTGPYYLGLLVALVVAVGLRSAGRGGPLAFELADIRHVLLSPADRRDSLRSTAIRSLRHGAFVGATAGGVIGVLAMRRLPNPVEWLAAGVVFGLAVSLLFFGSAMAASGLRVRSGICDLIGLLALGWSGVDLVVGIPTSPFTWVAYIATWPLDLSGFAFAGFALAVMVALLGTRLIEGMSIEAAERRSRLVGQLRFAATMQDVRTVMILSRQLSQQLQRLRPWIKLPRVHERSHATNAVFIRRSLQGLLRWPLARALRLIALVAVASACVAGAWAGTGALIVVGGIAIWIAALDLLEPLAQETDHPDRVASASVEEGRVHIRHLIVPSFVLFVLTVAAMIPLGFAVPAEPVAVLFPLVIPLVALAIGGAAMVVARPPYSGGGDALLPEVASIQLVWRFLVPPGLPILGLLPIPIARDAWLTTHNAADVTQAINFVAAAGLAFATWSILWIRYAEQMRNTFAEAGRPAKPDTPSSQEPLSQKPPSQKPPSQKKDSK